jgi:hypothetical protein
MPERFPSIRAHFLLSRCPQLRFAAHRLIILLLFVILKEDAVTLRPMDVRLGNPPNLRR